MSCSRPLNDYSFAELSHFLGAQATESEVRKIIRALYIPGSFSTVGEARGVRREVLARAREGQLGRLEVVERRRAADGFVKYLFRSPLGGEIEAVRIPIFSTKHGVCISSQVGCGMGCVFCQTGRMGFTRNLETWEMLEQVRIVRDEASMPVRHVVFMGMGEPLQNYEAVMRAAQLMAEPGGLQIGGRNITISTAGVVPAIHRYVDEGHPFRLAFSVTSALTQKRQALMPIERAYPLPRLIEAISRYAEVRGERAMIAYVMILGVNTGQEDVDALQEKFAGIPIKLDLIDVADAEGKFQQLSEAELRRFRDRLQALKVPVARRYSGGLEIGAACGTLAATRAGGTVF